MKRISIVFLLSIILGACSSTKITNSWKQSNLSDLKTEKILVMSRLGDEVAKVRFESELTQGLINKGYNALESSDIFPELNAKNKLDQNSKEVLIAKLKDAGISVVVVTILKDEEDYAVQQVTGGGLANPYYGGSYMGFYGYYDMYYMAPAYSGTMTTQAKKYVLETVVYDLSRNSKDQIIVGMTLSVDNPETLGASSREVSGIILKELLKK